MSAPPRIDRLSAADLEPGDRLISLGGVGFAEFSDPEATPVLVADLRPAADSDGAVWEIVTSAGTLYADPQAPAQVRRNDTPPGHAVLLVSRRRALHSRLLGFGVPVVRRTPVEDAAVPAVTAEEWQKAPLIIIDGYLSQQTLRAMWERGLGDRDPIVMVGTDPDDARVYGRQIAARARGLWVLPYDKDVLSDLLHAAIGHPRLEADAFLGILTPASR